jgi:hypothetical protein
MKMFEEFKNATKDPLGKQQTKRDTYGYQVSPLFGHKKEKGLN